MRSHPMLGTLLLLTACGGGTLYTTLTASPSSSPPDAITCSKTKLTQLGYEQSAFDQNENRLVVRKIENIARNPDPKYRRNVNRIEVEAAAGADGKTALTVIGHTFGEYETTRGPTEVEEKASADVTQAAEAVVHSCAQS
jgi:hypothetical protein